MSKRWEVVFCVAEVYVEVTADTEEDAVLAAEDLVGEMDTSLCHQCSRVAQSCEPIMTVVEEIKGEP